MGIKINRRNFLKTSAVGIAGIYAGTALSGCSSFDEYLFDDRSEFEDEVMIVGGGIAGLYLAHRLRNLKTEFRLFEGAATFGGRIKSVGGVDYGASLISTQDSLLKALVKELRLETKSLDKEHLYLTDGMQALTDTLLDRVIGLIPYRSFRLRWRLIAIEKLSDGFQLTFEHPEGQKRYLCRKVALAIPPTQWAGIAGLLDLPEMHWASNWLETMKVENSLKLVLPPTAVNSGGKNLITAQHEALNMRQILKKGNLGSHAEIDVDYLLNSQSSIDYIYGILRRKLAVNFQFQRLTSEQYYDWQQVKLIRGGHFRNFLAVPDSVNPNFQIVGDFTAVRSIYKIEGALESAQRAADLLL